MAMSTKHYEFYTAMMRSGVFSYFCLGYRAFCISCSKMCLCWKNKEPYYVNKFFCYYHAHVKPKNIVVMRIL